MKTEILAGVSEMMNDETNYFFDFDGGFSASYVLYRGNDTDNFTMDIELEVGVVIHDTLGWLLTDLIVRDFNVYNDDGEVNIKFSDRELKKQFKLF